MKKALGLFFLFTLYIFSQTINIEKNIEKDSVNIGERINISFKIENDNQQFDVVNWEDQFPSDVEIKNKNMINNEIDHFVNYEIACYDTGWINIAPFKIALIKKGIDSSSVYYGTDTIRIFVKSLVPDSASNMVNIKAPISYPFPWIKWVSILLGIIMLIFLSIFIYKKLYKKEKLFEDVIIPKRPAHEIAFEKLSKLDPENIYAPDEAKIFHFDLSYIFREYLENRFEQNYLEKTTFEIKPILKNDIKDNNLYHQIIKILNASDEVKFAKKELEKKYHKDIYNHTEKVIRETMVIPEILKNKENDLE